MAVVQVQYSVFACVRAYVRACVHVCTGWFVGITCMCLFPESVEFVSESYGEICIRGAGREG